MFLIQILESAIRERKKGKQTVKQSDTLEKLSTSSDIFSSRSKGKVQNATDVELCLQNVHIAFVPLYVSFFSKFHGFFFFPIDNKLYFLKHVVS